MSFWLFPLVRLSFLVIPMFYLFFGLEIFVASRDEVFAYALSYLLVSFLVQNALFSRVRWPLISEVYEVAQAPYLATQIFKTVLRPRAATFAVTAKDETLAEDYISPIYGPLLVLFVLMAAGVAAAVFRWIAFPGDRGVVEIVGAWAVFNFLLTGLALRSVAEKQQRRTVPRVAMHTPASAWLSKGKDRGPELQAVIADALTGGVRLEFVTPPRGSPEAERLLMLEREDRIIVRPHFPEAPNLERDINTEVQMVSKGADGVSTGLRFLADQQMPARVAVAYLIFNDSENWRRRRVDDTRPKGLMLGLLYILWLSVLAIPRTLADFAREPARRRRKTLEVSEESQVPVHLLTFGADFEPTHQGDRPNRMRSQDGLDFILEEDSSA